MTSEIRISPRTRGVRYAIRDVIERAKAVERKGREVLYLNIGDPLQYDFDTPEHIKDSLIRATREGHNSYAPSEGLPELRTSIAEKERRINHVGIDPEDVVVTNGVSEGIVFVVATLLDQGDEILVPGPTYPPYASHVKFLAGSAVSYRTLEEEGWKPDTDDIRKKITHRTKAILIINPNNPTGTVYDETTVRSIIDLAGEHGLPVVSDEIYDQITYGDDFISTASISQDVPVVGLNGFSKCYLMTGWRLGYVYTKSDSGSLEEVAEGVSKLSRVRLSANTPAQYGAVAALRGSSAHIDSMVSTLRRRRDLCMRRVADISGLSCARPKGAFYLFPRIRDMGSRWKDDEEFVYRLLEATGVLLVPGSGFGSLGGADHVRMVFLPPKETLDEAFDKMQAFLAD